MSHFTPWPGSPTFVCVGGDVQTDLELAIAATTPVWHLRADTLDGPTPAAELSYPDVNPLSAVTSALLGYEGLPALVGPDTAAIDGGAGERVAAPVPADAWVGTQSIGSYVADGPLAADWPTTGFDVRWEGQVLPISRVAGQWMEVFLSTIDEQDDYFEPAYVQSDGGIRLGIDFLDTRGEVTWISTEILPDPHNTHTYRLTVNATTGVVTAYIDGVEWLSEAVPGSAPASFAAPYTFDAPPNNHPMEVGRLSISLAWAEYRDGIDGAVIQRFDATDPTDWDALTGGTFAPFTGTRIVRAAAAGHTVDSAIFDIPADGSYTWLYRGEVNPAPTGSPAAYLVRNFSGVGSAEAWAFLSFAGFGIDYGFVIGDGSALVPVATTMPDGDHTAVAVLDRSVDELRLYIDGGLVGTGDATGLGAVSPNVAVALLPAATSGAIDTLATWDRALTPTEITAIQAAV